MAIKRAIIITPTGGKSFSQVLEELDKGCAHCQSLGYTGTNAILSDEQYTDNRLKERGILNTELFRLAKTIERISSCHAVHFSDGWQDDPVTSKLMEIALMYNVEVI